MPDGILLDVSEVQVGDIIVVIAHRGHDSRGAAQVMARLEATLATETHLHLESRQLDDVLPLTVIQKKYRDRSATLRQAGVEPFGGLMAWQPEGSASHGA